MRAGAGGDRRDAGGAGELGVGGEALGAGDLADELGGGQRPAAGLGEQLRRELRRRASAISRLERVDGRGSARAGGAARRGRSGRASSARRAPGAGRSWSSTSSRTARRRAASSSGQRSCRFHCSVLLSATRVRTRRSRWSTSSRMSSSGPASAAVGSVSIPAASAARATDDRVDLIGLAALAARAPRAGHQPRRDANDALAAREQEPLQRARDMPAVLQRPHPLAVEAARPDQQRREPASADRDRLVAEQLTGRGVDRRDRVRALVGVRPEHDHDLVHVLSDCGCWTPGGHGLLGALPRSYQVTPNIPDRRRATQQKEVRPPGPTASKRVSSPPGRDPLLGVGRHRRPNRNSKPRSSGRVPTGLGRASRASRYSFASWRAAGRQARGLFEWRSGGSGGAGRS